MSFKFNFYYPLNVIVTFLKFIIFYWKKKQTMHKQQIKAFIVNGITYGCNNNGIFIRPGSRMRQPRQIRSDPEGIFEQKHDEIIRQSGFNSKESIPYRWLYEVLHKSPSLDLIRSIATLFSHFLNIKLNRENYRKITQLCYWMDQNIQNIYNYLCQNSVQIQFADYQIICLNKNTLEFYLLNRAKQAANNPVKKVEPVLPMPVPIIQKTDDYDRIVIPQAISSLIPMKKTNIIYL